MEDDSWKSLLKCCFTNSSLPQARSQPDTAQSPESGQRRLPAPPPAASTGQGGASHTGAETKPRQLNGTGWGKYREIHFQIVPYSGQVDTLLTKHFIF